MPYALSDFMGVALPQAMPEDDLGTGAVASTLSASIGGVVDMAGSARRWPGVHQFAHKGKYEGSGGSDFTGRITTLEDTRVTSTGDTRVIQSVPLVELQLKTDAIKALIGQRGSLWRRRLYDGARSWKTCRLLQVNHVETVEQAGVVSEVESNYETAMNGWHAATATVVSGAATAGVALPLALLNSGVLPIYDTVLTVARTSGTISQVRVTATGIDITWTGSIGAGQSLIIDAGLQTVTVAGADQYGGFVLGATVNQWLALPVGNTNLTVTVTGGNATVTMSYFLQWP